MTFQGGAAHGGPADVRHRARRTAGRSSHLKPEDDLAAEAEGLLARGWLTRDADYVTALKVLQRMIQNTGV